MVQARRPPWILLAALLAVTPLTCYAWDPLSEEEVMLRLRDAILQVLDLPAKAAWPGWLPRLGPPPHHCGWTGVKCDERRRVTQLIVSPVEGGDVFADDYANGFLAASSGAPAAPCAPVALTPQLAQLAQLTWLRLSLGPAKCPVAGIPTEWWQPGAFPRLTWLELEAVPSRTAPPLPPTLPPGALPALRDLKLELPGLRSPLPAGWGAGADALPALKSLDIRLLPVGQLPVEWARGFGALQQLLLFGSDALTTCVPRNFGGQECRDDSAASLEGAAALDAGQPPPPGRRLPPAWAGGFPALNSLTLRNMSLEGSIPDAWLEAGALSKLISIEMGDNQLSGTLPQRLFDALPALSFVELDDNRFTGTLPAAWGHSQASTLYLARNALTGPAFPPAWLAAGALQHLHYLKLSGNAALSGTLPEQMPWPRLQFMELAHINLSGTIPAAWCSAPLVDTLEHVGIGNTSVDPALPACALDLLHVWKVVDADGNLISQGPAGARASPRVAAYAAAVAGLAAALAAASWAAVRRQRAVAHHERRALLQVKLPYGGDEGGSHDSSGHSDRARMQLSRRRQLAAALRRETRGGSRPLGVLPVQALPRALTHRLLDSDERRPVGGDRSCASSELELSARDGVAGSREWGLETASLQLREEQLEFVMGEDGLPVVLGQGGFGVVCLGRLRGTEVAVKVFELNPGTDSGGIWREAAMLRQCAHPHVVPLYGVAVRGHLLLLAMQLMRGGSLRAALLHPELKRRLAWSARGHDVALALAGALAFLHGQLGVMHGDLSSSNVLLDGDLGAHISDLGLARFAGSGTLSAHGFSLTHAAPEQVLGQRCSLAADVYSLGILLIELTTGQAVLRRSSWRLPRPPGECSQALVDLIRACTATDPDDRPSAQLVLRELQEGCRQ